MLLSSEYWRRIRDRYGRTIYQKEIVMRYNAGSNLLRREQGRSRNFVVRKRNNIKYFVDIAVVMRMFAETKNTLTSIRLMRCIQENEF